MKKLIPFLFSLLLLVACAGESSDKKSSEETEGEKAAKKTSFLPEAAGEYGEVVIVMNKEEWDGELGVALKGVFHASVPGLLRNEPYFVTRIIDPFQFNKLLKTAKNLVYVTTLKGNQPADKWLQNTFSDASKERIRSNPNLFMNTSDDQYARGQKVLQLFGKDKKTLISHLTKPENQEKIRNYFNIAERERLANDLGMSSATRNIVAGLKEKFGYTIKIPGSYELAMSEEDFMWARYLPATGASKNLFVYFKDYTSREEFEKAKIIGLRNEIGRKYIFGDPENPESYMTTEETYVPIASRTISFNDTYTVETKGAWKTNNNSIGGSFVSYTFVDEASKRLYYIEGFVIHPNEEHRESIRQLEALLTTFRPSNV